ncbi:MAG: ATP-binding protein [Victivallales bacterium]|nr:ATP-binding protein [Victivallales bacterium]
MKDLTTSIYNFEDIIRGNFLYVDKTEYIWQLIRPAKELYFLSRPRRFGKSLLISTLKAVFEGKRELFKGLALYSKPYDWRQYPVLHLDMANCDARSEDELRDYLARMMTRLAQLHNVDVNIQTHQLASSFSDLIEKVAGTSQAVILLDEYDKPILENIDQPDVTAIRDTLADFYSAIKKEMDYERFVFMTGVSKFSHVSLFSKLNNLTDITLNQDYAGMLGFTEAEIRQYYADRIPDAAKANDVSEEELMAQLLSWYDGYRFSEADTHVCNPVSITKFFANHSKFSNYWDSTGTPSFLLKLMAKRAYNHEAALSEWYGESVFSAYELDRLNVTGMLWQTGYYTIKDVKQGTRGVKYRLGFPDKEVQDTFCIRLLEFYGNLARGTGDTLIEKMQDAIMADDLDGFLIILQGVFANIGYKLHIKDEKYYQTIFFVVFLLLGSDIEAESCTNQGRIDAYIRTNRTIFIFEFKLDKRPDEALDQIIDRRYYEKFQSCGLPVRMVGVNFDSTKGRIGEWKELRS